MKGIFNASLVSFSGKTVVILMENNDHIPFLKNKEGKNFSVAFDDVISAVAPKPPAAPPVPPAPKA
jgi:hypothetical protein